MAFTYANNPVLSKIKIGDSYYWLKDADLRAIVDSFNADIVKGSIADSISGQGLITAPVVKAYVDSAIEALPEFDVQVVSSLPTASADTWHKIYLVALEDTAENNFYNEYITVRSGSEGAYTYSWEKIGSTKIDLSGYYTKTEIDTKFADYTKTADLGDLAFKDSASGTIAGLASGVKELEVPVAGNIFVDASSTVKNITSTGTVTAEGTVSGSTVAAGTVAAAKSANGAFQLSGAVEAPTVTVTAATDSLYEITGVGTQASFTEGEFTPASLTYAASDEFVKEGIKAAVGSGNDAETLIFSEVTNKGTASVISAFSGGSKAADTFVANEVATRATKTVATGIAEAKASAPAFTGDKFDLSFTGSESAISAGFTGTAVNVSVAGQTSVKEVNGATFIGQAAKVTPELVKEGTASVTVQ